MTTFAPSFTFDQSTWNDVRRTLHGIRDRAQNTQAAWNAFLDWFAHQNRLQFGTRGARYGTPWRELKPASLAQKRRLGYTGDILVRDSELLRSVADRPLNMERVGPHDMAAGTRLYYAGFHHRGAPKANIPARPLWDVGKIVREGAATSALKSWILTGRAEVHARTEGR